MKTALLTILLLCSTACNSDLEPPITKVDESKIQELPLPNKQVGSTMIEFQGTVKYITLEGGFYAIYADDGRKFTPKNLGELHRKNGLVVKVRGKILKDVVTFQQHGQVLNISSIEIIDDSKVGRLDKI